MRAETVHGDTLAYTDGSGYVFVHALKGEPVRHASKREYDPRCSYCWLGYAHTDGVHAQYVKPEPARAEGAR